MSRWDGFGWARSAPKKPPPERGIKIKKAGTTWWGQRWIEALQHVLRGDASRLARGRTYARAGRTHDLVIANAKVTAKVTGSRPTPYQITIQLTALDASAWAKVIRGLAKKAQFAAELLANQMPQTIDEAFFDAGVSLFPSQRADLQTTCSCPDWGDPCKHVAATHYVLGEALDRDPFLLLELRGRTKDQVLDALRAARGGDQSPAKRSSAKVASEAPTVKLGKLTAADYDKPRAPLPALQLNFDEPATHGAVLRQLGAPSTWTSQTSPADALAPLIRAAAATARRIAMTEPTVDEPHRALTTPLPPTPTPSRARRRAPAKRSSK